ncbi:MAG TPA: 2-amino-4-hydroxy-6-hydroxymethyldihydropteridine diphosphokinase [Desulfotomaculum sp.]|nr:2-amino-4-hydroxy-6-hydroxymethyldihydropteridine diphosphokinase [Desulfotomaculum sp.]
MSRGATAYIGLGSNLGDRRENLRRALQALASVAEISVRRVASLYRTAPIGITDQPEFLNTVVEISTTLTPRVLLVRLLQIENELGRVREEKWGPRVIDLDLLLYDDMEIVTEDLEIPHPRLEQRGFVVAPLAELAADMVLPSGVSAAVLADKLRQEQSVVRVKDGGWAD